MNQISKWLNQHPKLKNLTFWTSAVSAIAMIGTRVAGLLGYQIEPIINHYQETALLLLTILASLGILVSPPQSIPKEPEQPNQSQNP